MAAQINFDDFKRMVDLRSLDREELGKYVEYDRSLPIPRLEFKKGVIGDVVPTGYDVDREIYEMMRAIEQESQAELARWSGRIEVVAVGDSWFHHAAVDDYPTAIAQIISSDTKFKMNNIAWWGDTIAEIARLEKYMGKISAIETEFFMLSGGGNDLRIGIMDFIHEYDKDRPVIKYLTEKGEKALLEIGDHYEKVLSDVSKEFPRVTILCHGYDYPRPSKDGEYIGEFLDKKGIPESIMGAVMSPVIDKLNDIIRTEVGKVPQTRFLSLLNKSGPSPWFDDMHPHDPGFVLLAAEFESAMVPT